MTLERRYGMLTAIFDFRTVVDHSREIWGKD